MRKTLLTLAVSMNMLNIFASELPYTVVDTGQDKYYSNSEQMTNPSKGENFYGQDAQHVGNQASYKDNDDGTITDLNTSLTWIKARGELLTWETAIKSASKCKVAGYDDWRMPTIKELYSLIDFRGGCTGKEKTSIPYINTEYFDFTYGDEAKGERIIDSQDWSATKYVGTTMNNDETVFGVNFADGRIKGYPMVMRRREGISDKMLYVRYVRGNSSYGENNYQDNKDMTITDNATDLMWSKNDSGQGMNWKDALAWVADKNENNYLGHSDWRLPNAKELQSIVDYTQAPAVTGTAAIDSIFNITKSNGVYPFFWTSTTHLEGPASAKGKAAVYIAFGKATGWMSFPPNRGTAELMDVHGAGAQRSDPKMGNLDDYPKGRGPQGDVIRINNFVRLVRDSNK